MTNLSQVNCNSSLQYYTVDNCIVIRIDAGEKLDIVFFTESLLVAVPTHGSTSKIVLMFNSEVPYFLVPIGSNGLNLDIVHCYYRIHYCVFCCGGMIVCFLNHTVSLACYCCPTMVLVHCGSIELVTCNALCSYGGIAVAVLHNGQWAHASNNNS